MAYYKNDSDHAPKPDGVYARARLDVIEGCGTQDYPSKSISSSVMEHYGVKMEYDTSTGDLASVNFPMTRRGDIVGWSCRNERFTSKTDKWQNIGDTSVACELAGQSMCEPSMKKGLVVTEGETDMLSCRQVLNDNSKSPDGLDVVAISFGTANALEHLKSNIDFLKSYGRVYILFDGDEASSRDIEKGIMKGRDAARDVQENLLMPEFMGTGTKCFHVPVEDDMDVSDYHMSGRGSDLLTIMREAKAPTYPWVAATLDMDFLAKPLAKGVQLNSFPKLSKKMGGLQPHQLSFFLAPPKCGKTTVVKTIAMDLLTSTELDTTLGRVFIASLEESKRSLVETMVCMYANISVRRFRSDPQLIKPMLMEHAIQQVNKLVVYDQAKQRMTGDNVIPTMEMAHKVLGCNFFIIDHMHYIIPGGTSAGGNGIERIDGMNRLLSDFVKRYPVHVLAPAHVTMDKARLNQARKDATPKGGTEPEEPYSYQPNQYDARGSGSFAQMADNIVTIDKTFNADGSLHSTSLRLLESREGESGDLGLADQLRIRAGEAKFILL